MIKAVLKDEIRDIPYGKIKYGVRSIIPCTNTNDNKIYDGAMVTLAAFTKNGLKVIRSRIGRVVKANNNNIKIKFNTTFVFDNKLYALLTTNSDNNIPTALVLIYEEL